MIHTNIEEILKGQPTIDILSESDKEYVYKLFKDSEYILKGYKLSLVGLDQPEAREIYSKILSRLSLIYRKFYLSKLNNILSPHFFTPINFATDYEYQESSKSAFIYIEILFDYAGEPLESYKGKVDIMQMYNWMRQSANALELLHRIGVSYIDISLKNIIYNETTDLVKMIDKTESLREPTLDYAPPEVLQSSNKELNAGNMEEIIAKSIDVYYWGMCFYTLLFNKSDKTIEEENAQYKLTNAEDYSKFLDGVKEELKAVDTEDKKVKEFMAEILISALQYSQGDRLPLSKIVDRMRKFDIEEGIKLKYHEQEKISLKKINEMLGLQNFIQEQDNKLREALEQTQNLKDGSTSIEHNLKQLKDELDDINYEIIKTHTAIEEERKELELVTQKIDLGKEKESLEKEGDEITRELDEIQKIITQLEIEVEEQTKLNDSMFKDCESYTELQIKYATDTGDLFKEKMKLTKKLQEVMKSKV